jgi:hypothetical protein
MMERVEVRRVNGRWHAFNAGRPPAYCEANWSTSLGDVTVAEILVLFRSSVIVFQQPVER